MKKGKQGEGGGRPPIQLTNDQLDTIGKLAPYLTVEQLAGVLKISRKTFFNLMERNEEVFTLYKKAKGEAIASVANNLVLQAQNGNTSAAIFYLKTQAGWKETDRHEIVGDEEQPFVWKIQVMNPAKEIESNQ